jgi:hypothetical protein
MIKSKLQIALLIDGDNAQATLIPSILKALSKHGTCVIRRVYGDWTAQNMTGWRELERTHAIQLVQQTRYVAGKNATDIAITADAMEISYSGKVDGFCIVSSDSDFTPLVIRLKDKGTTVIGVGKSTSPKSFVNACSLFITTDTLIPAPKVPTKKSAPANNPKKTPDARPLLKEAYNMTPKTDEWVHLGALGNSLRQKDAQFKPKNYGHKLLSRLVLQYRDIFEIRTEKSKGKTLVMYIKLKM